ncbi:MAG: pseudouridine synthase, partial [Saprospiraceae bacterium]|nr:pseudouridine synthase [Saprospiraceae bacterium]
MNTFFVFFSVVLITISAILISIMNKIKLNVYLAHAGLCSRRKADELIKQGKITINHAVMKQPSYEVEKKDTVRHEKKVVEMGKITLVTIAVNKPTNVITTVSDEEHRQTIVDLVSKKVKQRVYPIGRLDRNTTGVILLTNDGELAQKLAHPKFKVQKTYQVSLNRELSSDHLEKIKKGLQLKDGLINVDSISCGLNKRHVRVSIHSGRNRIVRRIFEALGYTVRALDRTNFAGINKKNLELGEFRYLKCSEINKFKKLVPTELKRSEILKIQRSKPSVLDTITSIKPKKQKSFSFGNKNDKKYTPRQSHPELSIPKSFEDDQSNSYYEDNTSMSYWLDAPDKPERSDSSDVRKPRSESSRFERPERSGSSDFRKSRSESSRFERPERSGSSDFRRPRSESSRFERPERSGSSDFRKPRSESSRFERPERSGSSDFRRPRSESSRFERPERSGSSDFRKPRSESSRFERPERSGSSDFRRPR